jgi:hypothetical protein
MTQQGSDTASLPDSFVQRLGSDRPLDRSTRDFFEPRFGADFGDVRVHTDGQAARSARSVDALAYTVGRDIVFDTGQYAPETTAGKRLLAHELTHVLQQPGSRISRTHNQTSERNRGGSVEQRGAKNVLSRDEGRPRRSRWQCVNQNLSAAGVSAWVLAIVGTTCGLVGALAGSPTGPGAAGTAAFAAAVCIAGVIGWSVGTVLGIISGCFNDPDFTSIIAE